MDLLSRLLAVGHTWWLGGKSEPTGLVALFLRAIRDGRERESARDAYGSVPVARCREEDRICVHTLGTLCLSFIPFA